MEQSENFKNLMQLINPNKQPDKNFFLDLLDFDKQKVYEDEHIRAVMLTLKALYLNKLKAKYNAAKQERRALNSSREHDAEKYRRVLQLNAEIAGLIDKMNSYKPFFDEPYFARMDLEDDKEGYNSYYIGKRGDEGLEIVDWRAPLARKYYQKSKTSFSINEYDYKLVLRRALRTQSGKVTDMKNEYLSLKDYLSKEEIDGRDESIIFDPFLKEILKTRKEKSEITDIIETIQEKQYEIITLPERDEFAVQGVAGSGKTMIMLHRLSYILYNNESLKPSDVLVLTPSDSFNAFIDELAAILELERVKTSTIDRYFLNLLKSAGVDIESRIDNSLAIPQEYKKYVYSPAFAADIKKKLASVYDGVYGIFTAEGCVEVCETVKSKCVLQEKIYENIKNAGLRVRRCVLGEIKEKADGGLYYTKQFRNMFNAVSEVREFLGLFKDVRMQSYAYFYRQLLSFYKAVKFLRRYSSPICENAVSDLKELKTVIEKEIQDLRRYRTNVGGVETLTYLDRINKREQTLKEIEETIVRIENIENGFLPLYDFADVIRGESYLVGIGKCESVYDVLRFFYKETVKKVKTKMGVATKKLCRTDAFSLCYILCELGFSMSPKYAFVFVDEAQDISPSEYNVLKKVNDRAVFNVFGDLKQNITPYRGLFDWNQLGYKIYNLNLNYRNTNKIVEFVSKNLNVDMQAIGLEGSGVEKISPREVKSFLSGHTGLTAIITSENSLLKYAKKSYNLLRETGRISKTKINVMTVYESKGLEFTAVAVADGDLSANEKYIAYTRALQNLAVIEEL